MEIWYSFMGGVSEDDHIGFYDSETLDWPKVLEDNWEIIAQEIAFFIQNHGGQIKPYFNKNLVSKKKSWKTFTFFLWGWKVKKNMRLCPETCAVLTKIPNVLSASVSILEPGVKIKPHRGDTNAIMRSHLALKVPASLPECGLKVKYDERSWEEGKVLVFNDAARHEAWNLSDSRRYVLIVDVLRPEFSTKKYQVCSMVLGTLVMQQLLQNNLISKFPKFIKIAMLICISGTFNMVLRLRSFF
ncbi:MAG TPA: aspartyl/asparaginyl beta-hydroxylase domain-containing protein [Flavobacteriaceae bacterium]|nr:aspartyl/asparaginyl beta-hydroxylase domain-containing protein [Flavobacteriaceae bacterium]